MDMYMTKNGALDMDEIRNALSGNRGADQQRIAEQALRMLLTLLKKNHDYGCSVWQTPVLAPRMDPGDAILVRMSDKVNRLATLLGKPGAAQVDESIEDTLADLGAYAILYLARPAKGEGT